MWGIPAVPIGLQERMIVPSPDSTRIPIEKPLVLPLKVSQIGIMD